DERHPAQGRARLQVAAEQMLPVGARGGRYARVTVTGEIGEEPAVAEPIEIDELSAPRRLADEREALSGERVQRARFSRVRPAGKRDFAFAVRQVFEPCHALEECRAEVRRHGGKMPKFVEYQLF